MWHLSSNLKLCSSEVISVSKIDLGGLIWYDLIQKKITGSTNFGILQTRKYETSQLTETHLTANLNGNSRICLFRNDRWNLTSQWSVNTVSSGPWQLPSLSNHNFILDGIFWMKAW